MSDGDLQALVRRARDGSAQAWQELIRRYSPGLLGYLVRSVGNRTDAEELLQETFLRVVRGLRNYREQERFEVWLFRLARNLVIDHWRKNRPVLDAELAGDENGGPIDRTPGDEPDPADAADMREQEDWLTAAMVALPPEQRDAILMRYHGGLSFDEIIKETGSPLGTVLARVHRGLGKLRKMLKDEGDEPEA